MKFGVNRGQRRRVRAEFTMPKNKSAWADVIWIAGILASSQAAAALRARERLIAQRISSVSKVVAKLGSGRHFPQGNNS